MTNWRMAARLAWRDLLGAALGGMGIALACLMIGVAAIAAVGGMRASVQDGIDAQRRAMLGGDLAIESKDPLPDGLRRFLVAGGASVSRQIALRSMLYKADSDRPGDRLLVDLHGVDSAWPRAGDAPLSPAMPLARALSPQSAIAEPMVLARLHLRAGDRVRIGNRALTLRAALTTVPDAGSITLAPRVTVPIDDLQQAGLLSAGVLATWTLHAAWPGDDAQRQARAMAVEHDLAQRFPGAGWRLRDIRDASPGLSRMVDQTAQFLTLLGLTALLLGGLGVSAGVSAWMMSRRRLIGVLSSLGASSALIARIIGLQIGVLCFGGIAMGVVLGVLCAWIGLSLASGLLGVGPDVAAMLLSAARAAWIGILTALVFTIGPILRGLRVPPATLFRDLPGSGGGPRIWPWTVGAAALLLAVIVLTAGDRRLTAGFALALLPTLAFLLALGRLLRWSAAWLAVRMRHGGVMRLGVAMLARQGAGASRLVLGLGAGLCGLATIWLVEGALIDQFSRAVPEGAPSFYFIDIQPADLSRFQTILRRMPSVRGEADLPSLRTRVMRLNHTSAENASATPRTQWALKGDHGLTIMGARPDDIRLTAGQWWSADYDGPPLLSLDAGLATGWHVGVGDHLTLNVLGRDIDFRIANLRQVPWQSLRMNFAFVASPGLLSHAPHTMVATVRTDGDPSHDADVLAAVTDALPGATGIRVADVLATLAAMVRRLSIALTAMALVLLVSGLLVLCATLLAERPRRRQEAAILRALGASDTQLRLIWLVEFSGVGALTGLGAVLGGITLATIAMRLLLHAPLPFMPLRLLAVIVGALALMFVVGLLSLRESLRARPAALLRGSS